MDSLDFCDESCKGCQKCELFETPTSPTDDGKDGVKNLRVKKGFKERPCSGMSGKTAEDAIDWALGVEGGAKKDFLLRERMPPEVVKSLYIYEEKNQRPILLTENFYTFLKDNGVIFRHPSEIKRKRDKKIIKQELENLRRRVDRALNSETNTSGDNKPGCYDILNILNGGELEQTGEESNRKKQRLTAVMTGDDRISDNLVQETTEKFNEIKEVGFGDTEMDREVRNAVEEKFLLEKTEGKVVRATFERFKKVLVDLRQGGMGLYQRPYHHDMGLGELPELDHRANISAIDAALDTVKMLNVTEAVLVKMSDHLSNLRGCAKKSPNPLALSTSDTT